MNFPKLVPILLIHTFIFCLNTNYSNAKSGKETWKVFSDENAIWFNHLAVDEYGRWVYISRYNHIYQLSTDLELQINYTISELSPLDCTAPNCSHKLIRNTTTSNRNEVLVLDYQNQQLISCGIFFDGICHAHDMSNISKIRTITFEPVAGEIELYRSTTVAFIAPTLLKNSSTPLSTLYIGFVPAYNESLIQTVTIKNLEREHFSSALTQNTAFRFTINKCPLDRYDGLIYGFSFQNVGYLITENYLYDLNNRVGEYPIVTDTHKDINSCKRVPIMCNSGPSGTLIIGDITQVYIQKRNPDSGSKTDSHEMEEKIMFTLILQYDHDDLTISTSRVCRYQINKLHSQFQKNETVVGDLIYSHRRKNIRVTAMVVTSINNHTIVFFGTTDGQLEKISIKGVDSLDLSTANKYAEITIDAESRVYDMLFDLTMNFLYVMTSNKLIKVKIHNCNEYNTSHVCWTMKDPYCGWCFPSNKCCFKSECDVEQNPINWVSYNIDKCIDASSSPADEFSRTAESNVTFKLITPHPFINHTIICVFEFGNFSINTTTMCNENTINCVTPSPNHLPPTPIDKHSIEAELTVLFQKMHVIFYDCSTYETCSSCMSSPYPCKWYVNKFRCTDSEIWKEDDIVIGMHLDSSNFLQPNSRSLYNGTKFSKHSMYCPQFFTEDKSDIYIPANTVKREQIQVRYKIPMFLNYEKFTCKFAFDSKKEKTQFGHLESSYSAGNASKEGELKCNDEIFAYTESKPFITVELSILWNGSKALDNTYNTRIIVYKCAVLGDQCTTCLNKNYSCKWNSATGECMYYSSDDESTVTDLWLQDIQDCSSSNSTKFQKSLQKNQSTNRLTKNIQNSTTFEKSQRQNQSTNWLTENIHLIIILIVAVTFAVVAAFVIYYRKSAVRSRKMQQQMNKMGMQMIAMSQCVKRVVIENEIKLDKNELDILRLPNVSIVYESYPVLDANEMAPRAEYELPLDETWEIPRENVVLGEFLGEGEFGRVVKGNVSGHLQQHNATTVAVKMLKNNHKDKDLVNLVTEMELMKLIGRHDNVISLLGCCTQNGPLLVIIEYSPHGNLLDFLRNYYQPSTSRENDLTEKVQLTFALQIARGMEYLASIKLIHRDLAARNILIFDDYVLKIADFGLAKDIRNADYYKQKSKGRLPVKWMAPETLTHRRHSTQSDVWSYGILLWEIVTFGAVPYATYDDAEKLLQDIGSGYRMKKPEDCSMDMYCLMVKCWDHFPENRPDFTKIIHDLEAILKKMDAVIEESDSDCSSISSVSSHKANETNSLLSDTSSNRGK
ncbi:plexin-A4-like [Planococcus citri]|uniref:plexin-A4-like n=1 Tax=Planococcus citri TaxID=170843 RepID=UPI0031F9D172